ncbi:MAG: glycosyltransferase [Thermodesulfobacteriota bacterium]|nr:glycosyltransferase [Thermodesulfobacteriota bacterium]
MSVRHDFIGVCELRVAFVSGLSDKKLAQKLLPLQALDEVEEIHLYRRRPYRGDKIHWVPIPRWAQESPIAGDLFRFFFLLIQGRRWDLFIGCHQSYHGLMAYLCGKIWRKPVIQIVITQVDWVYKRRLLRPALLSADACAVRGPISSERLRDIGYKERIYILQNPYVLPAKAVVPMSLDSQYDLVAVGDFVKEKDYPWMMEVLTEVKKGQPGLRVAIVGRGAFRSKLGSFLKQSRLDASVNFLGWKDQKGLKNVYCSSRALILTSNAEGLPMVVLEAMSYGLPVFVTDVGDLPWLVRDGKEGRIVAHGDTRGMSDAILQALGNPNSLKIMGENAYARMASFSPQFGVESIAQTWLDLLSSLLQKGRS